MDQNFRTSVRGSTAQSNPVYNFYTAAKKFGFAKDNLFRVTNINLKNSGVSDPNAVKIINDYFNKPDNYLFVKSGTIPTRKINSTKVFYKSFGFNVPTNSIYSNSSNWNLKFYSDDAYFIKNIFELWSQQIYNEHGFKSNVSFNADITISLYRPIKLVDAFKVSNFNKNTGRSIKDTRKKEEQIDVFNLEEVRQYILYGCFPIQLGEITYDTTKAGNLVSIDTVFAYQYISSKVPSKILYQQAIQTAKQIPDPGLT